MENPLDNFSFTDPFTTWWPFIIAAVVGIVTTIRSFIMGPVCPSKQSMAGKTVVMTGGSKGVGLEVTLELLNRGARVILGTRNEGKTQEILLGLVKKRRIEDTLQCEIKTLDLSSMKSVRRFAAAIDSNKVDVLINNAGLAVQHLDKTEDGFESHFGVNYLAHFLLTMLLLPKLKAANEGRVINTAAGIHNNVRINVNTLDSDQDFSPSTAFARSKLALIIMARSLASSWVGSNVTINAVNPGLVRGTDHNGNNSLVSKSFYFRLMVAPSTWFFMKTPQQAAQTIIYMAVADEVKGISGRCYSNCSEVRPTENAMDFEQGRNLILKSLQLCGLTDK